MVRLDIPEKGLAFGSGLIAKAQHPSNVSIEKHNALHAWPDGAEFSTNLISQFAPTCKGHAVTLNRAGHTATGLLSHIFREQQRNVLFRGRVEDSIGQRMLRE